VTTAGALDGLRVLELGTLIAGPFVGRLLGDMGLLARQTRFRLDSSRQ